MESTETSEIKPILKNLNDNMGNYVFLVISIIYFLIIQFYFNSIFVMSDEELKQYKKDTIEKNYSFTRFLQVILKNIRSYGIASAIIIYFLMFMLFFYFKLNSVGGKGKNQLSELLTNFLSVFSTSSEKTNNYNYVENSNKLYLFVAIFFGLSLVMYLSTSVTLYIVKWLFTLTTLTSSIMFVLNILIFVIAIGGLYMYLRGTSTFKTLFSSTKMIVFMKLLEATILYIPCLVNDIIASMSNTKTNTKNHVFIVFMIEVALIILNVVIPVVDKWVSKNIGNVLLDKPIYLNIDDNVSSSRQLYSDSVDNTNKGYIIYDTKELQKYTLNEKYGLFNEKYGDSAKNMKGEFDNNYSLSFWFYINSQPLSGNRNVANNTRLIDLAKRPIVEYNTSENRLYIKVKSGTTEANSVYTVTELNNIKLQKWNHIVVNYSSGFLDVFLDGVLVDSKKNVIPSGFSGPIVVGSENGINGRIANIAYYNQPLNKILIDNLYNSNKNNTIPSGGNILINSKFLIQRMSQTDIIGKITDSISGFFANYIPSFSNIGNIDKFILRLPENIKNYTWNTIDYYIFDFSVKPEHKDKVNELISNAQNKEFRKDLLDRNPQQVYN